MRWRVSRGFDKSSGAGRYGGKRDDWLVAVWLVMESPSGGCVLCAGGYRRRHTRGVMLLRGKPIHQRLPQRLQLASSSSPLCGAVLVSFIAVQDMRDFGAKAFHDWA